MSGAAFDRAAVTRDLTGGVLDVLVIGGGIVGAGIARDAAMRGLRTGLVEQYDFAFGTSSRSSRLLHGGLRYLAQGRIGLVREASLEKGVVSSIAPHLCAPLPFVFPTYRCPPWGAWAHWKLAIGVKIYDLLCSGRNLGKSRSMKADETAKYLPGLCTRDLTGAVRYFDGLTNDARLVIDTLRSAAKAGAQVLNYLRLESATPQRGGGWICRLRDQLSGGESEVSTRAIVNATGPWAEQLATSSIKLRLTKGVHLVIDRNRLPVPDAIVLTDGPRILFVIPWGERVILGTTDTDYDEKIEAVHTDPEDVRYILKITNRTFPAVELTEADVIGSWAGLRPLVADPNGKPSDISRAHEIRTPAPGWWDVAGGKLTTYRLMAEQTVDGIERALRGSVSACRTAAEPLLTPGEVAGVSNIVPPPVSRQTVEHYCRREWAIHLADVMIRRTSWHYYDLDAANLAVRVASWMAEICGWDRETEQRELEAYRQNGAAAAPEATSVSPTVRSVATG